MATPNLSDPNLNQLLSSGLEGADAETAESNRANIEFAGINYPCRVSPSGALISVEQMEDGGLSGTMGISWWFSKAPEEFTTFKEFDHELTEQRTLEVLTESRFLSVGQPFSFFKGKTYKLRLSNDSNEFLDNWKYVGIDESCRAQVFVNTNWKPQPVKRENDGGESKNNVS